MKSLVLSRRVMVLTISVLTVSSLALGQYIGEVRNQLEALRILAADQGYIRTHDYAIEVLRQGQSDSFDVTLQAGWEYAIASVCDGDCSDLDVTLYDERGNLIDMDESIDSLPMVEVIPRWSGVFTVRVSMYSCNTRDCVYGVGVFGR